MNQKAIVLLSGGLDSTTTLAIAQSEGFQPITLCFDYGQRHRVELVRARAISKNFGVLEHREIRIDLRQFGGSALQFAKKCVAHSPAFLRRLASRFVIIQLTAKPRLPHNLEHELWRELRDDVAITEEHLGFELSIWRANHSFSK